MEGGISALEALVLLIQHYPRLSGEGLEVSSLGRIEEELGMLCLKAEDFAIVTEWWTLEGVVPTLTQYLAALEEMSASRVRSHGQ